MKDRHERLEQAYDALREKYEAEVSQRKVSIQSPMKEGFEEYQTRICELENKLQLAESQNDLLNKMVQELEKTNQDYLVKLEKSIEKQAQPVSLLFFENLFSLKINRFTIILHQIIFINIEIELMMSSIASKNTYFRDIIVQNKLTISIRNQ